MNVAILGGGIAGLSSAFYLAARTNIGRVNLFEASSRFAGWMKSESFGGGYTFESSARTLRPRGITGNTTLELIQLLELENKTIPINSDRVGGKFRLTWSNSKIGSYTPAIDANLKVLFGSEASDSESLYDFTVKKISQEFADSVIDPMVRGICAGDARKISARFLVKGKSSENFEPVKLYERARKEKWSFYSLQGGLETLPKKIVEKLAGEDKISMNLNSTCQKIDFKGDGTADVTIDGKIISTGRVISSLPSFQLAPLVQHQHPELARELSGITSEDSMMVNLHFKSENLLKEKGFGVFLPSSENPSLVGIIFDSSCVEMNGTTLTVMFGGPSAGVEQDEKAILKSSLEQVEKILGISEKPDNFKVTIMRKSFPQYSVGHYERLARIRSYISVNNLPLSLCGQSYDGIGINEVILSAKTAANGF